MYVKMLFTRPFSSTVPIARAFAATGSLLAALLSLKHLPRTTDENHRLYTASTNSRQKFNWQLRTATGPNVIPCGTVCAYIPPARMPGALRRTLRGVGRSRPHPWRPFRRHPGAAPKGGLSQRNTPIVNARTCEIYETNRPTHYMMNTL
jgi:hypothetical protein